MIAPLVGEFGASLLRGWFWATTFAGRYCP